MKFPIFQIAVTAVLAIQFVHYFVSGMRVFSRPKLDDAGEMAGAVFCVAGAGVLVMARVFRIAVVNGVAALFLVAASLFLYEWARRAVSGRGFFVIYSDNVPESVCESGPYAYVRHPFYLSYIIGFSAALVAFPKAFAAIGWVLAVALFVCGAHHDERVLKGSALASDYARYRNRTGMFIPVFNPASY